MDNKVYDKSGKVFLIVTLVTCIIGISITIRGFNNSSFTGGQWFIAIGTMSVTIFNGINSLKERRIYYGLGTIIISLVILLFGVIPQLIILF